MVVPLRAAKSRSAWCGTRGHILFCDLCEGQGGRALKIDILAEAERGESLEGFAVEEVGLVPLLEKLQEIRDCCTLECGLSWRRSQGVHLKEMEHKPASRCRPAKQAGQLREGPRPAATGVLPSLPLRTSLSSSSGS